MAQTHGSRLSMTQGAGPASQSDRERGRSGSVRALGRPATVVGLRAERGREGQGLHGVATGLAWNGPHGGERRGS